MPHMSDNNAVGHEKDAPEGWASNLVFSSTGLGKHAKKLLSEAVTKAGAR